MQTSRGKIPELEPTPEYEFKPKLIFVGKLFGMDLYIDIHGVRNAEQKHKLAIKWLAEKTAPPKQEVKKK